MNDYFIKLLDVVDETPYTISCLEGGKDIVTTDRQLVESFYFVCRVKGLSPITLEYYANCLASLNRFLIKSNIHIIDINIEGVRHYIVGELDRGVKPSAVNTYLKGIKVFLNYIYNEGFLPENVAITIKFLRVDQHSKPVLSIQQIASLLSSFHSKTYTNCRDYNLILLAYDGMLRLGELVNLNLDDLHLIEHYIKVFGKARMERFSPVSSRTARSIHSFLIKWRNKIPGQALFCQFNGSRLCEDRIYKIMKKHSRRTGIDFYPHKLRRSGATAYLNNGGNIHRLQIILGHIDIRTTQEYACPTRTDIIEAFDKYSPASKLGA